jgi:hypothetical protein
MQNIVPLLLIVALAITGCDVQRGRFVSTGDTFEALSSPVGSLDIVDGYEKGGMDDQQILYVLIVTPSVEVHGSSSGSDFGQYVTTLHHSWITEKGIFTGSISWNRQADLVTIGNQQFVREKGDIFLVRLNAAGEISGQQFASPGSHISFQEVLKYIRQQLPNDALISSAKLDK